MIAICTIKAEPHYRRDAFVTGLGRAGYTLVEKGRPASKADLLVMWNRQGPAEALANTWEQVGGTVLVVENGYAGADAEGRQFYAIAAHGHNGSGWFPVGDEDRFGALGLEPAPWHAAAGPVLVCGQRGIGSIEMASPTGFENRVLHRVKNMNLPTRLRRHPGAQSPKSTLDQDLEDASACVIWSSTSGVRALLAGVPVVYCAPHWIGAACASRNLEGLSALVRDDDARRTALHLIAWGQRSVAEIASGEPFVTMRERIGEAKW